MVLFSLVPAFFLQFVSTQNPHIRTLLNIWWKMQRGTNVKKELKKADRRLYLERVEETFRDWLRWKDKQEKERRMVMKEQERTMKALKEHEKRLKENVARVNREMWLKKKAEEKKREEVKKQKLKQAVELQKMERERMCQESVEKWMKEARYKPKPTRNNMGLASLICTNVGKMNPIPWKDILERDETK